MVYFLVICSDISAKMTSATYDEAQTDWENVQEIVPKFKDQLKGDVGVIPKGGGVELPDAHGGQSRHATLEEVILDFKSQDLSSQISQAEVRLNGTFSLRPYSSTIG